MSICALISGLGIGLYIGPIYGLICLCYFFIMYGCLIYYGALIKKATIIKIQM